MHKALDKVQGQDKGLNQASDKSQDIPRSWAGMDRQLWVNHKEAWCDNNNSNNDNSIKNTSIINIINSQRW